MPYTEKQARTLAQDAIETRARLDGLLLALAQAAAEVNDSRSQEHLSQGAGRRVGVLAHCFSSIFEKFPPSASRPLSRDVLYDVQIAHHAFVINLYGYFENLAWAFMHRHGLLGEVRGRKDVGLFLKSTQRLLPASIREYLASSAIMKWHDDYLKNYRDALAHRVPLYIPPSTLTKEDIAELEVLEDRERVAVLEGRWDLLNEIMDMKNVLGQPCLFFAHSFKDNDQPSPILLHPQILCDVKTIIEFTDVYLAGWHERA